MTHVLVTYMSSIIESGQRVAITKVTLDFLKSDNASVLKFSVSFLDHN